MADELDPLLEARLRVALRTEVATLPLTITTADLLRERSRRRNRRWAVSAALIGVAAVVALLVVAGATWRSSPDQVAGSPSPSATGRPLATYEELTVLVGGTPSVLLRGEHPDAGTGDEVATTDIGGSGEMVSLVLAGDCLGGELDVRIHSGITFWTSYHADCQAPFRVATAGARVTVVASTRVTWRIVVGADPHSTQLATAPLPSPEPVQTAEPSIVPIGAGETPLVTLDLTAADGPVQRIVEVPEGTDSYRLAASCAGDGELAVDIDGIAATYPCGAIGIETFTQGWDNQLEVLSHGH